MATNNKNIASLLNKDTLNALKNSEQVKTFGDQTLDKAKQKVTKAFRESKRIELEKEKILLINEEKTLKIDHKRNLFKLEQQNKLYKKLQKQEETGEKENITTEPTPTQLSESKISEDQKTTSFSSSTGLSDEEYQKAVELENKSYNESLKNLQERKEANKKALDELTKDKKQKQKDAKKKRKERLKKRRTKLTEDEKKARKAKRNAILRNPKKTIVSIITLLLTDKISEVVAQNGKIGELVDNTNNIILEANESGDPVKLQNAKLARDSAIKIIQSNEDKIIKIKKIIEKITLYINIFGIIVAVINAILQLPIPVLVPLKIRLQPILQKALQILSALSALLSIILIILQKAIDILENYKSQLLDINGQLEDATINEINGTGSSGLNAGIQTGILDETYKGFRFAIREDNSFGGVSVGGFKRHYAVAIDKNNVDVLKSELSFTLDPDDLISQLKLVIDQQNLIA